MKIEKKNLTAQEMIDAPGQLITLSGHLTGGSKKTHLSSFLRGQEISKDEVENLLQGRHGKVAVVVLDDMTRARMLIEPDKFLGEIHSECKCPMVLLVESDDKAKVMASKPEPKPDPKPEAEDKKASAKGK